MKGFITTKDLVLHPWLIVSGFGLRVYARCVCRAATGHGRVTFLECI